MIIERIHIRGFGRWVEQSFDFPSGFSLWIGPNESGKSTLSHAILAGLYGLGKKRTALREIQERFRPWQNGAPFGVELELKADGIQYRLVRDLAGDTVQAYRRENGHEISLADPEAWVIGLTGLNGATLFRSTLMVTEGDVAAVEDGRPGEAIAAKIAAGDEVTSLTAAIRWLDKSLNDLVREGRSESTFSELQNARNQMEYWGKRLEALDDTAVQEAAWAKELQSIEDGIRERESFRNTYGPLVKRFDAFQSARAEYETTRQRLEGALRNHARIEKAATDWKATRTQWESWSARKSLALERRPEIEQAWVEYQTVIDRLNTLQERRDQLEVQMDSFSGDAAYSISFGRTSIPNRENWYRYLQLKETYDKSMQYLEDMNEDLYHADHGRRIGKWGWMAIVGGLVLASVGGLKFRMLLGRAALLPAGFVFIVLGIAFLIKGGRANSESKRLQLEQKRLLDEAGRNEESIRELLGTLTPENYEDTIHNLEGREREEAEQAGRKAVVQEELHRLERDIQSQEDMALAMEAALRKSWLESGAKDQTDYRRLCQVYDQLAQEERINREKAEALLNDKTLTEWEENLAHLTAACKLQEARMAELRLDADALAVESYRERLAGVDGELARMAREEAVLKDRLATLRHGLGEVDRFRAAAELESWREKEQSVQSRAKGIRLAIATLREAGMEVQTRFAPGLEARTAEIFARVTRGRYRQVRIAGGLDGKDEFRIEVENPSNGNWISPASLSSGARDQLYIALRIALGEYLTGREDFPLFFDDPFLHYDPARLAATVGLMKSMGERQQVIWLTKDPRLAEEFRGVETMYVPG